MKSGLQLIAGLVAVFWAIAIANIILGNRLNEFGILPRDLTGLRGILLAPFIHSGLAHVLANTPPFIVLGGLVAARGKRLFLQVTLGVALIGGLGVWLFARPAYHVGASGVVFGYFGFLLASGYYRRSLAAMASALLALLLYGGLILSLLPGSPLTSWEGHLFGFLAGIAVAKIGGAERGAIGGDEPRRIG